MEFKQFYIKEKEKYYFSEQLIFKCICKFINFFPKKAWLLHIKYKYLH